MYFFIMKVKGEREGKEKKKDYKVLQLTFIY
jgi:hypothetical protein